MHGTQKQNDAVPTYLPMNQTKPNHQSTINPTQPNQTQTQNQNQPTNGWAVLLHIIAFKWLMLS
jgi:hypothetical protein